MLHDAIDRYTCGNDGLWKTLVGDVFPTTLGKPFAGDRVSHITTSSAADEDEKALCADI